MNKDLYPELSEKAYSHPLLHHYTTLRTLKIILKNFSLRLNRLDLVNDSDENKRITSLWNGKVFASCFTNTLSNEDYFWNNYGNIRISFAPNSLSFSVFADAQLKIPLKDFKNDYNGRSISEHTNYSNASDWCVYSTNLADVYYTDDLDKHKIEDGYESNAGLIKMNYGYNNHNGKMVDWEIESETRIRVAVRPIGKEFHLNTKTNNFEYHKPDFTELYIPLPKKIAELTLSPKCTKEEQNEFSVIKKELIEKNILYS